MTKYLETKRNSIEEAISSVVLGEKHNYVVIDADGKILGFADDVSQANTMVGREGKAGRAGYNKLTKPIERNQGSKLVGKSYKSITNFLSDKDVKFMSKKIKEGFASDAQRRAAFAQGYKAKGKKDKNEEIDEGAGKYSKMNLDKAKKLMGPSKNREQGVKMVMKGLGTTYKHANQLVDKILGVNPKTGKIESAELGEGYESEVLKVLKDADIDGYFKMGKLYVSRRDARDAKKALENSDEITKLPKMVMEDERMKKLTKRQRQALARVQAKPKSQVSLPKMPDFMKLKKEENEMDIVDTIRNVVEKKLDPVNKDAVKKKFDDRKDKDIDNDGDVDSTDKYLHKRRKAISKAIAKDKNEAYDIGKDYAQHTLEVTPGQDKKDVDKMLNTAYTKNQSMRETLAKVWGLDEGKSPFQKEEEKPLTKTMTGQKPTTVKVNPKIEEK